ncbi:DUF1987 domain-containing protein [Eisenibacter elegans]|jgi:hypothetical protein|uniref:DUF1987 domain-containing protein n=1 Tax=Eisenibacter elegans TaxID=997 RepID=UPI000424F4D6|nr:DUF1987 domain-containing protein [Eisenibacter elegans]
MDNIHIKATSKTPAVNFDYAKGLLEISGRSIPENSYQFYDQLLSWLDHYATKPQEATTLIFKLDYFNTASSMYILGILKRVEKIHLESKKEVKVQWFFETDDEDMLQTGEDLRQVVSIPIETIEVDADEL